MAATCRVYGTIYNLDLAPNEEVTVVANFNPDPVAEDLGGQVVDGELVTTDNVEAVTDKDGFFEIFLVQGAMVRIEIARINLRKVIVVPNTVDANLLTLI